MGDRLLDFYEGLLKIANVVLAVIAGYIALMLFRISDKRKELVAWKGLIFALIFFAIQEILGAWRAFNIYSSPYLTHINVSIILGFLIYALIMQIYVGVSKK